ncbi:MAG: stress response translation initiation inhibitor YciH [Candidatus Rokuibacteriota bacterium]|nr:MAG: stress response translation initiation inhibitor YciH [Candidatus Rokubacteria bacterium]
MSDRRLVYSTDPARSPATPGAAGAADGLGPDDRVRRVGSGRTPAPSRGSAVNAGPRVPEDGVVRILRDRNGRGGKVVTVVHGLPGDRAARTTLAAELRRLCGAGGAVKADTVELQGDHRERVAGLLRARGYRVKLAGG